MSLSQKTRASISLKGSAKQVQACRHYTTGTISKNQDKASLNFLRDKKMLPDSDPPSGDDVSLLYQFIDHRSFFSGNPFFYVIMCVAFLVFFLLYILIKLHLRIMDTVASLWY